MTTQEKDIIIRELLEVISNLRAEINDLNKAKRTIGGRTFVRTNNGVKGVIDQ